VQAFGTKPLADWPFAVWPALSIAGFQYPDLRLRRQVAERRARIVRELPGTIDLLAIGLAGGKSLEQTLLLVPGESRGVVGREFGAVLREVAASRRSLAAALDEMAARNGVPELAGLLTHLRASMEHGTANLVPILTEQAATLRTERRLRIVAEAKRAQVRMLLPVGVGILPVLIVVLLAPAAMQLLSLGG
jgi:tight adherence protein C